MVLIQPKIKLRATTPP